MSYIEDRIANCERYIHDLQDGLCELEERHNALLDGVGEIYNRLRLMEKEAEPTKIDIERFKKEIADYTNESGYVDIPLSILLDTLNEVAE